MRTDETKRKLSVIAKARIGRKAPNYGREFSKEHRKNLSFSHKKLSDRQIKEIRRLLRDRKKQAMIANIFKVDSSSISNIKTGKSYMGVGL